MTGDMMALRGLMEKSADADLLREMIGFAAERADGAGGAGQDAFGEKEPGAADQRDGYRERD